MRSIKLGGMLLLAHLIAGTASAEEFKLYRYVAQIYNTNSYLLESESGIALIDGQALRSDAKRIATLIRATGKPLEGAIVTHPHADHFGGLNALRQELGPFPIYTTKNVADGFKKGHESLAPSLTKKYGDDFDPNFAEADQIVEDGATVTIAGIDLVIDDIGPGESENSLVIHHPDSRILFTGDATMHGGHFYLGEGYSDNALEQHRYIKTTYGDVNWLYPGHGDPGSPGTVLDSEIGYIEFSQAVVKEALATEGAMKADGSGLTDEAATAAVEKILEHYPHLEAFGIVPRDLVSWNVGGIAAEFLGQ